jgi:hypothetical protein
VILVVATFGAYQVSEYLLANDWNSLGLVAIAVVGLIFAMRILNNWRDGLYIFFGWLFFEDFARKYLGNNMAIYFAKDLLVILIYISFYLARRRKKEGRPFRPTFRLPLLVFLWFAFAQVFNPASSSFFYGLLGLKLYFLYVPLIYIGYSMMSTEEDLRRFFLFNAYLLLIVGALGVAQAIIGPKFLNPTTIQEDIRDLSTLYRISPITGLSAYRPTSVFVSTGRFQNLIVASWVIVIGFGGYLILRTKRNRIVAFLTVGVLAASVVMSTSRGVVMWCGGSALVVLAAFVWGAPWKQGEATRVIRSIQRVVMLGGLAVIGLAVAFPEEVQSRFAIYSETLSPYSTASELAYRTRDYPLRNFLGAFSTSRWLYGYGTGTASLGIQYVARILHAPGTGVAVENGYGQLVIEMGVVGLILWVVLGVAITVSAWRVVRRLRGSPWFPIAFTIFWLAFLIFFPIGYNSLAFYQDFLINAYFWILLGILYRLPSLALSAQFAAAASGVKDRRPSPAAFPLRQPTT